MNAKAVAVSALFLVSSLLAGARPEIIPLRDLSVVKPVDVQGEVTLVRGADGGWHVSPWLQVRRAGSPVSGLEVTVAGRRLKETMPGQYAGVNITDFAVREGAVLAFRIRPPALPAPHPGPALAGRGISGTASIGSLARFDSPLPGAHLHPGALLAVTWTGGSSPFTLSLLRTTSGSPNQVFSQEGIVGFTFTLTGTLFAAGNLFNLVLTYPMNPFMIGVDPKESSFVPAKTSQVKLRCSIITTVTTDAG